MINLIGKAMLGAMSAGLVIGAALPAAANPPPTLQYRIEREQNRINQGVANGSITRAEYNRDQNNLRMIKMQRNADGSRLTDAQQAQLRTWLNGESNRIYYTKHNRADQRGM